MKNMKLSVKLTVAFGTVLVLMSIIIIFSTTAFDTVNGMLETFYNEPYTEVQLANQLNLKVNDVTSSMLYASASSDNAEKQQSLGYARSNIAEIYGIIEQMRGKYDGDMADIDTIVKDVQGVEAAMDNFESVVLSDDNTEDPFEIYKNSIYPEIQDVLAITEKIQQHENEDGEAIFTQSTVRTRLTQIIIAVLGVGSNVAGVLFAVYITRLIAKGVKDVERAAVSMAAGNFDTNIEYTSKDEIGRLADSMRNLSENTKCVVTDIDYMLDNVAKGNLDVRSRNEGYYVGVFGNILSSMNNFLLGINDTMSNISNASDQVASGAEQVSGGAQSLSQGATEQASSIEELSATISMISDMVNTNARDAADAAEKTDVAGAALGEANGKMNELVEAMNEISASSAETQKIIKTIEDIAFQTNILALNAAVEAARAGAAGKGFAVVADEVRNLAGKSAEAAKNTTALIEGTVTAIEKGNSLVTDTAEMMNTVAESAGAVAKINGKIAESSKNAAEAIIQVTTGVEQISAVVQTNSATAEESAAASEELAGQSGMLKGLIEQFRLAQ
ncbi:MAG: HAMP domain-containing protein [Oscillospiraceae bacterium]|nr:HAMP domain-containing protein [Oscillospiraceae bacterium]